MRIEESLFYGTNTIVYQETDQVQSSKLGGAGSPGLEYSCGSLKFLQGAQRCTVCYTHHLYEAYEDAIGLPGKSRNFEP